MPTVHLYGHEQVTASLQVGQVRELRLTLTEHRVDELHKAINQAINCRPDAPKWLFELTDLMEAARAYVAA